jgi:hypothetical protein
MTFLNLAILGGLVLVAIPIIIHLLNRRKAKLVDWGAMRFLLASLVSRNRRILIEEIILMCLRCLVVLLVVLAVARPFLPAGSAMPPGLVLALAVVAAMLAGVGAAVWARKRARIVLLSLAGAMFAGAVGLAVHEQVSQSKRWSLRGGEKDVAIVIDASASMSLSSEGKTNFQRAIDEARAAVEACKPADSISIVLAGPVPRRVLAGPTVDRQEVASALADLAPMGGPMAAMDALRAALAAAQEGGNPAKKIVVITDGQDLGWDLGNEGRWSALASEMRDMPSPPKLIVRTLPTPRNIANLAIVDVTLDRKVVGTDRKVRIDVKVANYGSDRAPGGAVELLVDGVSVAREALGEVPVDATAIAGFEHQFDVPGAHVVTASLVGGDDLPFDNTCHRAIRVLESLPVLLVEGVSAVGPLGGSTGFLQVALAPRDDGAPAGTGSRGDYEMEFLVEPKVVQAGELEKVPALNSYRMIALVDVPRLPARTAAAIAEYVKQGGGLLIAPGASADREFYNRWSLGEQRVTPATLGEARLSPASPPHLAITTFTHPALEMLADSTKCPDAAAALLKSYWPLECDQKDASVRSGGLDQDGRCVLAERKLGKGLVLMTPFSLDRNDTNLPTLKSFLPLVHEMTYYLAAPSMLDLNVAPAAELAIELPAAVGVAAPAGTGAAAAESGGRGLKAEYFADKDLKNLRITRLDPQVNFDYKNAGPDPSMAREQFSARWTGRLRPPRDGEYTLHVLCDDGARLWIDGKQVIDAWSTHPAQEFSSRLRLRDNRTYDIRLEYFQDGGEGAVQLLWSGPKLSKAAIPAANLTPAAGAGRAGGIAGPLKAQQEQVNVLTPSQRTLTGTLTSASGGLELRFAGAQEPGLYRVIRESTPEPAQGLPFVVTSDPAESRMTSLSDDQFAAMGAHGDVFRARSTAEMSAAVAGGVPGEEIWKYLAMAALLGMLAEIGLTRWIATQRKMTSTETVAFGASADDVESFRARAREMVAAPAQAAEGRP